MYLMIGGGGNQFLSFYNYDNTVPITSSWISSILAQGFLLFISQSAPKIVLSCYEIDTKTDIPTVFTI